VLPYEPRAGSVIRRNLYSRNTLRTRGIPRTLNETYDILSTIIVCNANFIFDLLIALIQTQTELRNEVITKAVVDSRGEAAISPRASRKSDKPSTILVTITPQLGEQHLANAQLCKRAPAARRRDGEEKTAKRRRI